MLPQTQIRFDSVLLFALVIPFVMAFRIGPVETPYWLFGIIFVLLLTYLLLDLFQLSIKRYTLLKNLVLLITIVTILGSAFASAIIVRHQTHPIYMIHDIILQQEAAIRYLVDGKNPYHETYFGTFMEQWHYSDKEVNPALHHFVMEPFYLISALPFYWISNHTIGYFDGRMPLLALFAVMIVFGVLAIEDREHKRLLAILFAFHPSLLPYTLEGRSDIYMYAFLIAGFYFLLHKKNILASMVIALAFAVKQSAWPLFPFYFLYLFWIEKDKKKVAYSLIIFAVVFGIIIMPFYFWHPQAFIASTISFLSGNAEHSYPISGYGLGSMLLQFGLISEKFAYYPFIIWQAVIGIPTLIWLGWYLSRKPSVKRLIICYGLFLFVFWYLSRYFNNSHLAYLSLIFITAYFWPEDNDRKINNNPSQTHKHPKA